MQASGGAGAGRIGVQHDALLAGDQSVGPDACTRLRGELWGDEVRMRSSRTRSGQLQHLRAQCRQHAVVLGQRHVGCVQAVEVVGHGGHGLLIGAGRVDVIDERTMADADSAQEAGSVLGRQRSVLGGRLGRSVHPDVEDARGDGGRGGCAEQVGERAEQVAAHIGDPQGRVAQALQFGCQVGRLAGVAIAQHRAPDSGSAEG